MQDFFRFSEKIFFTRNHGIIRSKPTAVHISVHNLCAGAVNSRHTVRELGVSIHVLLKSGIVITSTALESIRTDPSRRVIECLVIAQ